MPFVVASATYLAAKASASGWFGGTATAVTVPLEGFIQHPRSRDILRHGVELAARQRERICLAVPEQGENLVVALIAGNPGVLQMGDRTAHGGGIVDGGDLDAELIERLEIRRRRPPPASGGRVLPLVRAEGRIARREPEQSG